MKYPLLVRKIAQAIKLLKPKNKIHIIPTDRKCLVISCYSCGWENLLGWKSVKGSKFKQEVSIPKWILENTEYSIKCLEGLIEIDGSVYNDRGYIMMQFTTITPNLAYAVFGMIEALG